MGNKNEKVTDYNASSTSVLMKKMLNIPGVLSAGAGAVHPV